MNKNKVNKTASGKATGGLVQQGFCVRRAEVQNSTAVFQLNFSNNISFCTSKSRPNAKPQTVTTHTKKTVQTNKNTPYYLTAVGLFILLKFGFTLADNNDLTFLLKPTDKIVGLLTGSQSVYISDSGYFHEHLNIIIDKSCSGFNFLILCFLLFAYLTVKHFDKSLQKILMLPTSLFVAYVLTIFVNTSRIFASILVQSQTKSVFFNHQHIIHEAIGITTNLTFLILAYVLIEKLLTHKRYNAKFA